MLLIRRITTFTPIPLKIKKVSSIEKTNIKIRSIHKLSPFFKDLFETYNLNALFLERMKLLKIEELAIIKLIEESNEENRRIIISILEETYRKINKLNLKIYALLHEIPISENDIRNWKEEIIKISDFIFTSQQNKIEYPSYIIEFLNLRISRLANLKEAISYYIDELEKKIEEFQQELNAIKVKHSVGLLNDAGYRFLKENIEETIRNTIEEIEYLKNYHAQIKFTSQVQLIEKNLHEISQQIANIEQKYKSGEISINEYNKLITELKRKESELNEQLMIQKKNEEHLKKIKSLKNKVISSDIDKLLA